MDILGTYGRDMLIGTADGDDIFGLLGPDTIYGGSGDDGILGDFHINPPPFVPAPEFENSNPDYSPAKRIG